MFDENEPAFPLGDAQQEKDFNDGNFVMLGVTKKEYIATKLHSALLVNAGRNGLTFENAAKEAVRQTNKLIEELNKCTNTKP